MSDKGPFVLAQDEDSHWYVIPADKQSEWSAWCDIDPEDERSWQAPAWSVRVGGASSLVEFSSYQIK